MNEKVIVTTNKGDVEGTFKKWEMVFWNDGTFEKFGVVIVDGKQKCFESQYIKFV